MNENEQLTREQAEACLTIVQSWIGDPHTAGRAKLYEPGFHCDGWAIAMDGGPFEWPYQVTEAMYPNGWPDGVFAEPGSNWYLGLYPA
jgi:hypothetical protein